MSDARTWIPADWPAPSHIIAGTTTRLGGVSQAPYDSFNLATHCGDELSAVQQNRKILSAMLPLPSEPKWLEQIHSDTVIDLDKQSLPLPADAAVTTTAGIACVVLTADCLPILICDQRGGCVAAIHAGWRGLCQGIIAKTLAALAADAAACMAWLGPAISQTAYQVGREVYQAFVQADPDNAQAFLVDGDEHYRLDMYQVARRQLRQLGVTAIYGGDFCTMSQPIFYSYRRDHQTGRMASLIVRSEL